MQEFADLKFYLIYAREEIDAARQLKFEIEQLGVKIWLDEHPRRDGHVFPASVRNALFTCDAAIVLWSQTAADSIWVEKECTGANELRKQLIILRQDKTLVPVKFKPDFIISFVAAQQLRTAFIEVLRKGDFAANKMMPEMPILHSPGNLRDTPLANFTTLDLEHTAQQLGFYENKLNPGAAGMQHDYQISDRSRIVQDYATGLAWQKAGSSHPMDLKMARAFIDDLNREKYCNYTDWRLPTCAEALSLVEPARFASGLYIDPVFDSNQSRIWTADYLNKTQFWTLNFELAQCLIDTDNDENFVRAVRTLEIL